MIFKIEKVYWKMPKPNETLKHNMREYIATNV